MVSSWSRDPIGLIPQLLVFDSILGSLSVCSLMNTFESSPPLFDLFCFALLRRIGGRKRANKAPIKRRSIFIFFFSMEISLILKKFKYLPTQFRSVFSRWISALFSAIATIAEQIMDWLSSKERFFCFISTRCVCEAAFCLNIVAAEDAGENPRRFAAKMLNQHCWLQTKIVYRALTTLSVMAADY